MSLSIPQMILTGMLGGADELPGAPAAVTDLAATANLDGTITVSWTLPEGADGVLIRYNVDQAAAPATRYLGISLGFHTGTSLVLTGVEYGAVYRFSAWTAADESDTASATGPLNPAGYGTLKLWLDARRETAYSDGGTVTTPTDYAVGGFGLTQATAGNRPIWRNAANGINSMPSFRFAADLDAVARCWVAAQTTPTVDTAGAGAGFSVAAIATTEGDGVADKTLIAHWAASGSHLRRWRLFQSNASNVWSLGLSTEGDTQTGLVTFTGLSGAGPYSMVSTYVEGTGAYTFKNGDGLDDTDLTVGGALIAANTTACLRVGNGRGSLSDPYYGEATLILGYSAPISRTAAELLDVALAGLAGT